MANARVIRPSGAPLNATVRVPGSKSIANRALVCSFLAGSESVVSGLPSGDDTDALLQAMDAAGALGPRRDHSVDVKPDRIDHLPSHIDARLAGTTSRFLTAVASLCPHEVTIDGEPPLRSRPMEDLHVALRALGGRVECLGDPGRLPVRVGGVLPHGGQVSMRGNVSSQFVSALMLVGPALEGGLTLALEGALVSASYVQMTARVMREFGASVELDDHGVIVGQGRYGGRRYVVDPDFSSAAFPICGVLVRGGLIRISGLARSLDQGDSEVLRIAEHMGANVEVGSDDVTIRRDSLVRPRPISLDMSDCSDLVPAVAVACAVASGTSELSGVGFIRNKESDRIGDLVHELRAIGAMAYELDDGIRIVGVESLRPAQVGTHHDHRLAMALSIAALSAGEVAIGDPDVVSKSWPTYFEDMTTILG